jgi:hypothetical protein
VQAVSTVQAVEFVQLWMYRVTEACLIGPVIIVVPRMGLVALYPARIASAAELKVTVVELPEVLTVPAKLVEAAGPLDVTGVANTLPKVTSLVVVVA